MVQDEAVLLPADGVPEGAPSNLASPQLPIPPDSDAAACEGSDERKEAPAPACSPAAAAAALGDLGAAVEAHAASAAFLARRMRTLGRRGGAFGAILDARGADCERWSAALLRDFLPALALEKHGVAAGAPPRRGDDAPRPRDDDPPRPCDGSRFRGKNFLLEGRHEGHDDDEHHLRIEHHATAPAMLKAMLSLGAKERDATAPEGAETPEARAVAEPSPRRSMGRQLSLGVLGRFLPSPAGRPSDGASTKDAPKKDAPSRRSFGAGRRDSSQASLGGENYSGTLGDASFEAMEDLTAGAVDDDEGGDIMGFCLNGREAILPESLLYWDYVMCFFILV